VGGFIRAIVAIIVVSRFSLFIGLTILYSDSTGKISSLSEAAITIKRYKKSFIKLIIFHQ
jgi:hypothetical protein